MTQIKKNLIFLFACFIGGAYASDYLIRTHDGAEHSLDHLFNEHQRPIVARAFDACNLYKHEEGEKHLDSSDHIIGYPLMLNTSDGFSFRGRHYYGLEQKQTLIVLSLGMGSTFEECEHHAKYLARQYDVLIFQYRWAPLNEKELVRHTVNSFFTDNHEEVIAAARLGRLLKYEQIIGLGECYSGFMFPKAQALCERKGEKLFDKLILDSGMISLENYVRSMIVDPCLMCKPLTGGIPNCLKPCTKLFCAALTKPVNYLYRDDHGPIEVMRYLPHISVPILFIRGKNDPSISWEDFERAWNSVIAPKTAFITPFHHSNSFQHAGRPFYLAVVHHFIDDNLN
jgi:hypothetical protein